MTVRYPGVTTGSRVGKDGLPGVTTAVPVVMARNRTVTWRSRGVSPGYPGVTTGRFPRIFSNSVLSGRGGTSSEGADGLTRRAGRRACQRPCRNTDERRRMLGRAVAGELRSLVPHGPGRRALHRRLPPGPVGHIEARGTAARTWGRATAYRAGRTNSG